MRTLRALPFLALVVSSPAFAADPKFEYGKAEEVKAVEWKASAQAGLILTTGNSRTTTLSAGAAASRKAGADKFQLELAGAFAESEITVATDANSDGAISENEIDTSTVTTTKSWLVRARWDHYFTDHNSLYVSGKLEGNEPAGKDLIAGGQVGYSRLLVKTAVHEAVAEAGYDFSYENYTAPGDAVVIHSARVFAGYIGKLSAVTGVAASLEALFNLNSEDTPSGKVDALQDTRLTGKAELTTKIYENISFRFAFTAKYDHAPAPKPPFKIPYAAGFVPLAETLDTTTEVGVIVNFL